MGFYDIPINFTFLSGNRYEVGVYALPAPPGLGTALYTMELQHFDQNYCAVHSISCAPFTVGGLQVFEGGSCADSNPGGPPDCIGSSLTYLNDNFPHLRMTTDVAEVPEPATLLLFGTTLLGIGVIRRKKIQKQ